MPAYSVDISAPSRLHFGMFSFGCADAPQFGGVGVMLDGPGLRLRARRAETFAAQGPLAQRAAEFARRWAKSRNLGGLPACEIEVISAPKQHVGLGTGTQLGLSVGAALHALFEKEEQSLADLAASVGRVRRSSIGAYGFAQGGLIGEAGKQDGDLLGRLIDQINLPAQWKFLLLRPSQEEGCCGEREQQAFANLPPVPKSTTNRLHSIFSDVMAPAARHGDFREFSTAVYAFGRLAGSCFATAQFGEYATKQITETVDALRSAGVQGVGQSSWGPTVFALFPNEHSALGFAAEFLAEPRHAAYESLVVGGSSQGASIETRETQ